MLVTKKTAATMGLSIHDGVGSKVSVFARRQMEKMGWQEGKGLGKNETGISKHIKAVKRDDSSGLGSEAVAAEEVRDNWWHDAFSKQLKSFLPCKDGKKSKSKKAKKDSNLSDCKTEEAPPSYADLFAATGGARLGMRARASQKGKILRTEGTQLLRDESLSPQSENLDENSTSSSSGTKSGKKKSRSTDVETTDVSLSEDSEEIACSEVAEPETKRKKKSRSTDISGDSEEAVSSNVTEPEIKKKKKTRSTDVDEISVSLTEDNDVTESDVKRKKKKSKIA